MKTSTERRRNGLYPASRRACSPSGPSGGGGTCASEDAVEGSEKKRLPQHPTLHLRSSPVGDGHALWATTPPPPGGGRM